MVPGGTLEIVGSDQVYFTRNQVAIRVTRRVDGRPWLDGPITLGDGETQVSPFVILN